MQYIKIKKKGKYCLLCKVESVFSPLFFCSLTWFVLQTSCRLIKSRPNLATLHLARLTAGLPTFIPGGGVVGIKLLRDLWSIWPFWRVGACVVFGIFSARLCSDWHFSDHSFDIFVRLATLTHGAVRRWSRIWRASSVRRARRRSTGRWRSRRWRRSASPAPHPCRPGSCPPAGPRSCFSGRRNRRVRCQDPNMI